MTADPRRESGPAVLPGGAPIRPRVLLAVVGAGLLAGGIAGRARYVALDDARPVCVSCHHGTLALDRIEPAAPHSTNFNAECHACHVLPVREYLQYSFLAAGMAAPAWVADMRNPTIGGQTCLECHLGRGRGALACEQCHADGTLQVRLDMRCEACHEDHIPLHPHTERKCRECHAEVFLDPDDRGSLLMNEKLGTTEAWRKRDDDRRSP